MVRPKNRLRVSGGGRMGSEVDIANLCVLDDVRIYEVGIRLDAAFEDDGDLKVVTDSDGTDFEDDANASSGSGEAHDWELHVTVRPYEVEFRARLLVRDRDARYLVDAGVRYKSPQGLNEVPRQLIIRFIETTAVAALLPVIRSEVRQGAAKIGAGRRIFKSLSGEGLRKVLAKSLQSANDERE